MVFDPQRTDNYVNTHREELANDFSNKINEYCLDDSQQVNNNKQNSIVKY